MSLPAPSAAKWKLGGVLPPSSSAYVDAAQDFGADASGSVLTPYSVLQTAYNAGAKNLVCAPGSYGNLTLTPGDLVTVLGNQIDTIMGTLTGSGGCAAFLERMVCGALNFTDHVDTNFAGYLSCEMAQAPTTYNGGDVGGHGQIQCTACDFGDVATFHNFKTILFDSYSEWQFFTGGGVVTSSVAGPILLEAQGIQGNALILVNEDENLISGTSARYVLPKTAMTASRTFSLTTGEPGDVVEVYSYNESGFSALFKSGATTLVTDVSIAHVSLYRFKCTVANTTWTLDNAQRLG